MKKLITNNKTLYIIIAISAIILIFIFWNGGNAFHDLQGHRGSSFMNNIVWPQVFISLVIGVFIGLFIAKRKW